MSDHRSSSLDFRGSRRRIRKLRLWDHWPRGMSTIVIVLILTLLWVIYKKVLLKGSSVMRTHLIVFAAITVFTVACAKRVPEPVDVERGVPHVSWVIMYGDRDTPDRQFACQSTPRNDCVIPASRPDEQVFSDVHFYYHGAGPQTAFTGTVNIGFFGDSRNSGRLSVNAKAEKAESIANQSIVGVVSSKPGTYEVTIDVMGTVGGTGKSQPVQEKTVVVVR